MTRNGKNRRSRATLPAELRAARVHVTNPCNAEMPLARDRCGQTAGHKGPHRTRWAMDNRRDRNWYGVK